MLLTLKQPSHHHGFKSYTDYAPPTPPSTASRYSPGVSSAGSSYPAPPPAVLRRQSADQPMSTPHRGLPPPAAMTLPPPGSSSQSLRDSSALVQSVGQLPAAPPQWQGAEESMRNWLHAKAEEDKRRQEEEKTRQETLRLEQRKIEQDMLRTSIAGGIPPYMIPMVFAGMGGGNLPNASIEWAQQYMAQQARELQQQQLQLQQQSTTRPGSPSMRRETISHPFVSSQHPIPATLPSSTPIGAPGTSGSIFAPGYTMSPGSRARQLGGPSAHSRAPQSSELPRLSTINTGVMQINPPPQGPPQTLPGQPLPSQPSQEQETEQSPGIYFHHWQPPTSQAGGSGTTQPPTPNDQQSNSPKKRKAQGPQTAAPPPTSQPQYHSPPFSHAGSSTSGPSGTPGRRRGHSTRSERASTEFNRSRNRHHHNDSESNSQFGISPDQQGYMPSQDGPISSRRNTLQMPRDDRTDPRQQPIHLQHHPQHQHHQSQPTLQSQPSHSQPPHYNDNRNIYSSGPDLRREVGRGGERSPDADREMSSRLHSMKRDERE